MIETTVLSPDAVTVAEAAARLGVTPRRVLQLIETGELEAQRVGNLWLVRVTDVERRESVRLETGRRFSPGRAWGLLFLVDGLPTPWLDRFARSRLRAILAERGLAALRPRLAARGRPTGYRAHPSDLARLASVPGLMRTGAAAGAARAAGLLAPEHFDAYLSADRLSELTRQYRLRRSENPNVILRVTPTITSGWPDLPEAPAAAVALDLVEDPDPRTREVGASLLARYAR